MKARYEVLYKRILGHPVRVEIEQEERLQKMVEQIEQVGQSIKKAKTVEEQEEALRGYLALPCGFADGDKLKV